MKRNQYKLLAEKYNIVREGDKEDILAGLEELQFDPKEPITRDNIKKLGFQLADPQYRNFYEIPGDGPELRLLCQLYLQAGYAWYILDAVNVKKYSVSTLGQLFNKYNKLKNEISLQESDKEDIMAGLGELESWIDAPFTPLLEALTKKGYKVTNVEYNFSTNPFHNNYYEEGFIRILLSVPNGLPGMYLILDGPGVYDDASGEDPGLDSVTALDIDQTVSVVINANQVNQSLMKVLTPTYIDANENTATFSIEIGELPSEVKDRVINEVETIINTIKQYNA